MKKMKRFIAIAAAIAMLAVANAVPAFADTPAGTLTMEDQNGTAKASSSYSAYQIATFDLDSLNGKPVFTNMKLNPQNGAAYRTAIINNIPGLTAASSDDELFSALSKVQDRAQEAVNLADALAATVAGQKEDYDAVNGKFDKLPYGYYLVMETANNAGDGTIISKPILVCVPDRDTAKTDVVAKVKTSQAGITKKIVETDPQDKNKTIYVDTNTTSIGKDVNYRSLSTFPVYSKDAAGIDYIVTDTFSDGLSFDTQPTLFTASIVDANASKTVLPLTQGTDYTLTPSKRTDGSINGFTLTLINKDKEIKQWGIDGDQLQVLYSATLNKDAKTGTVGNPNSVQLTYSVKPGDATSDYTTPLDTVITYTYKLVVTKKSNTGDLLQKATFDLRDSAGNTVETEITDQYGIATFTKLEQGDYSLVETKAPQGYNLLSDPIKFNLTAQNKDGSSISNETFDVAVHGNDAAQKNVSATWNFTQKSNNYTYSQADDKVSFEIKNFPGFVLPGTGGIGTVIFTVSGIAILLVGGCMAFLYYRKKKKSERQ